MFQKLDIGVFAALKVVDCFGVFDPSTSSIYLALYQVINLYIPGVYSSDKDCLSICVHNVKLIRLQL